ncbi:hypothetical protein DFH06DRAFT_1326031 [Mycena polygramma]|nr:hypothetical protein DFH06DRAFT_1326031 [Mycena polygramma]
MHFLALLSFLLPSLIGASPPAAVFGHTPTHKKYDVLSPVRHPKDDPTELAHLKGAPFVSLHYEGFQAASTVNIPVTKYPVVSLDKSDLASAACNYA